MEAKMAHFFLLIFGLVYATIAKRLNIITMGPTVGPNFVVVQGKSKSSICVKNKIDKENI